jgi:hypothetical protein
MVVTVTNAGSMSVWQTITLTAELAKRSWLGLSLLVAIGTIVSYLSLLLQSGNELDLNRMLSITAFSSVAALLINTLVTLISLDQLEGQPRSFTALLKLTVKKLPFLVIQLVLFVLIVLLGFGFLLIPGMILMITLLPATTLLIIHGYDPISTLRQSHKLVWGCWWRVANVYSVYSLVSLVLLLPIGWLAFTLSDGTLMQAVSLTSALTTPLVSAGLAILNLVLCQDLLMRQQDLPLADFTDQR